MARYTLATGEPIFTGFMRQRPGARFWAIGYSLLHLAQVGWPGWALAGGSALAALLLGRVPRAEDRDVVVGLGYLIFLGAVGLVLLGRRAQRALEITEWIMMAWMLRLLVALAVRFVPGRAWAVLAWSFAGRPLWEPGWIPSSFPADPRLGARHRLRGLFRRGRHDQRHAHLLAARQGLRDGGHRGGAADAGRRSDASCCRATGAIFPPSEANLAKWREWWRYLRADLSYLWTAGCLIGMGLPVLLALDAIPPGTDMGGFGAGAVFARELARRYWALLWLPALLTTLWIFFSTQVGIAEGFARNVTEMLWTARRATGERGRGLGLLPGARALRGGGVPRHDGRRPAHRDRDRRQRRGAELRGAVLPHAAPQSRAAAGGAAGAALARGVVAVGGLGFAALALLAAAARLGLLPRPVAERRAFYAGRR